MPADLPSDNSVPPWLWRASGWALAGLLLVIALLAAALALGAADPPRAGPLSWEDDFKRGLDRWTLHLPPGGRAEAPGALVVTLPADGAGVEAFALAPGPAGDFTIEVAAAASDAQSGAAYGLVFDWQDAQHYQAVLVNGNGYAEAYTQAGTARIEWFAWQQWPHLLAGAESNRVRVDVSGSEVIARVNDEVLAAATLVRAPGRVGVAARGVGQVIVSWVRVWE